MAIYAPGKRDRHGRPDKGGKRSGIVILSLTAMVDMFTVLTVFLLQNYKVDAITLKKSVALPKASAIKKLKPAHVVVITEDKIFLDETEVADTIEVKEAKWWDIVELKDSLKLAIQRKKEEMESGLKNALTAEKSLEEMTDEEKEEEEAKRFAYGRVTIQCDKTIDVLTVKKVMYTIHQAGASLINFAVTEVPEEKMGEKEDG